MTGGYIMIDCHGLDLTKQTSQRIEGIYKRLQDAMTLNKPIYAIFTVWGLYGPITPIHVFAIQTGANEITCTASTLQVIVNSTDGITIHSMV